MLRPKRCLVSAAPRAFFPWIHNLGTTATLCTGSSYVRGLSNGGWRRRAGPGVIVVGAVGSSGACDGGDVSRSTAQRSAAERL